MSIVENKTANLDCKVFGYPPPAYAWFELGSSPKKTKGVRPDQANDQRKIEKCTNNKVRLLKYVNSIPEIFKNCL